MMEARRADGKTNHNRLWVDGKGVFDWWIGKDNKQNPNQASIFEFMEDE